MTQTVYLKLSQITQVHEKNVPLASLGEVYCSEKSVESRCRAMIVKRIRGGGKQRESRLVGNVMEIIQQIEREIPGTSVQNLGGDGLCHSLSAAAPSGACLAVVQDAVRLPDLLFRGGICDHDIQQRCKRAGCIQENI